MPVGALIVMKLFVPSLETPPLGAQLVVVMSGSCCNAQPVEGYGQLTFKPAAERVMVNRGVGVASYP